MKQTSRLSIIIGFLVLFTLYHLAEYMIVFKNSATGFLGMQGLFFYAAWLLGRWQFGKGYSTWGFVQDGKVLRHIMVGIFAGILMYTVTFFLSNLTGAEHVTHVPQLRSALKITGLFVFGNFFSSFSEDILTRGYVYRHAQGKMGRGALIIFSASIYLFNHIYRLGEGVETYAYLFVLGILFVTTLVQSGQIWTTGGIHWAGNCTFYVTHEVIQTSQGNGLLSPNLILSIVVIMGIAILAVKSLVTRKKLVEH